MPAKILAKACLGLFFWLIFCQTAIARFYFYRDAQGVLHITNVPVYAPDYQGCWRCTLPEELFWQAARRYQLDPALLKAIARAESNFDPRAVSPKGALGLMQLMPETAAIYGVEDPFNPRENLLAAAAFLRDLFEEFGNWWLAIAAYNAGPERVRSFGGVPPFPETRLYLERVKHYWQLYRTQKNWHFLTKNP